MERGWRLGISVSSEGLRLIGIKPSQAASAYDASIQSFTDDGFVSDRGVMLDIQLAKERIKMTKEVPLSQVVDWSLLKEIKEGR